MDGTIVVGVDGSPTSREALRWAVDEARVRGCAVEVIMAWHVELGIVVGPASTVAAVGIEPDEIRNAYQAVLDETIAGVADDVEIRPVLVRGDPRSVLVDASKDAALLVVGSRGAGSLRGMLVGSVSAHCVHHAHCPVVVVREPAQAHR